VVWYEMAWKWTPHVDCKALTPAEGTLVPVVVNV